MSDNIVKLVPASSAAREEAIALGIAVQEAKDFFALLGMENTQTEPAKRAAQIARYERARVDMYEKMNKHEMALFHLGRSAG